MNMPYSFLENLQTMPSIPKDGTLSRNIHQV